MFNRTEKQWREQCEKLAADRDDPSDPYEEVETYDRRASKIEGYTYDYRDPKRWLN
jgi:hypothetical protein